ncbi:cytochrome P450, putative [Ixodes scapularis]|uniref:Cytochrome P450, putative n=1 Tax=Ixodes scapularis TaxID=6945 RepID=B7QAT5_IXOSC|nr:cytochrome P450, putative [Ixodes scapularis]|eukprot:XP_002412661.1 cytochrome P450, putative [Ixodes scapularis]
MCTTQEELRYLIQHISMACGTAIPVQEFLLPSTSNVITALLFGTTLALDDPKRKRLIQLVTTYTSLVTSGPIVNWMPDWLSAIVSALPFSRMGAIRGARQELFQFVRNDDEDGRDTASDVSVTGVEMGLVVKRLRDPVPFPEDPGAEGTEGHLLGNAFDFYIGGTHTPASFIHWLLAVCAQKQDTVQSRIQREIDDHIGCERQPTWEDSKKMHFTMATPSGQPAMCVHDSWDEGEGRRHLRSSDGTFGVDRKMQQREGWRAGLKGLWDSTRAVTQGLGL